LVIQTGPGKLPSHRRKAQQNLFVLTGLLLLAVLLEKPLTGLPLRVESLAALAVATIAIIAVVRTSPRGIVSFSSLYVVVFSVFHFGFTAAVGVGLADLRDAYEVPVWFHHSSAPTAIWLTILGVLAYGIGASAMLVRQRDPARAPQDGPQIGNWLTRVGFVVIAACVLFWFGLLISKGLLLASYYEYRTQKEVPTEYVFLSLAWGLTMLAAGAPTRLRLWGFLIYSVHVLFAFPLGLRGEVLFPITAAMGVAAARGARVRTRTALLSIAVLLSLISMGKGVRDFGLGRLGSLQASANPIRGLVEMGMTLHPVCAAIEWIEGGDAPMYGATYWAPFDRALGRVAPSLGFVRLPAEEDPRVLNKVVQRRVGNVGFSVVAEAYYNLGPPGVALVMMLVGGLMGWMDTWPAMPVRGAIAGIVMYAQLYHVRNNFISIPSMIILGILVILLVVLAARLTSFEKVSEVQGARSALGAARGRHGRLTPRHARPGSGTSP